MRFSASGIDQRFLKNPYGHVVDDSELSLFEYRLQSYGFGILKFVEHDNAWCNNNNEVAALDNDKKLSYRRETARQLRMST